jgi:hypothetical protein
VLRPDRRGRTRFERGTRRRDRSVCEEESKRARARVYEPVRHAGWYEGDVASLEPSRLALILEDSRPFEDQHRLFAVVVVDWHLCSGLDGCDAVHEASCAALSRTKVNSPHAGATVDAFDLVNARDAHALRAVALEELEADAPQGLRRRPEGTMAPALLGGSFRLDAATFEIVPNPVQVRHFKPDVVDARPRVVMASRVASIGIGVLDELDLDRPAGHESCSRFGVVAPTGFCQSEDVSEKRQSMLEVLNHDADVLNSTPAVEHSSAPIHGRRGLATAVKADAELS